DQNPPAGTQYYQIAAIKPTPCDPYSQAKLTAIEMDRSVSNIRATSGSNIDEIESSAYTISPNPNKGMFSIIGNINSRSDLIIEISDVNGKIMHTELNKVLNEKFIKHYQMNLVAGIYFVKITDNNSINIKKLIIN
ncbi:MAG: T9SS type A sorting domain-containing protein, partial [Bacteroidota bacterium]